MIEELISTTLLSMFVGIVTETMPSELPLVPDLVSLDVMEHSTIVAFVMP